MIINIFLINNLQSIINFQALLGFVQLSMHVSSDFPANVNFRITA